MKRCLGLLAVGLAAGLAFGIFLYPRLANRSPGNPAKPDDGAANLVTRGSAVLDAWPVARSWTWNVPRISPTRGVAACVRTVETDLADGESPSFQAGEKPPAMGTGRDRQSGWTLLGGQAAAGQVSCQLVDFGEVGLAKAADDRPLRLLVRLKIGAGTSGLTGPQSVLDGQKWVHLAEGEAEWVGEIV